MELVNGRDFRFRSVQHSDGSKFPLSQAFSRRCKAPQPYRTLPSLWGRTTGDSTHVKIDPIWRASNALTPLAGATTVRPSEWDPGSDLHSPPSQRATPRCTHAALFWAHSTPLVAPHPFRAAVPAAPLPCRAHDRSTCKALSSGPSSLRPPRQLLTMSAVPVPCPWFLRTTVGLMQAGVPTFVARSHSDGSRRPLLP